jgi:predicted dehydrogenase
MSIRTLHVGVGGRGVWPIQMLPSRDDFVAVALADINPVALEKARAVLGLPESACFRSMEEAMARAGDEAEAVIVITPPQWHAEMCLAAVKAGKHVLVEKPFTLSLAEAREIVAEADRRGVAVAVCQNDRFSPVNATLARLVREEVGPAAFGLMSKFGWRPNPHHSGHVRHSYLWERGVHDLDTLRTLLNAAPVRVSGYSFNPPWSPYDHGSGTHAWIEFDNGASAGYTCTFAAHTGGSSLRLECVGGSLQVVGGEIHLRRPGAEADEILPLDPVERPEKVLLDGFSRYVTEGVEPPFSGHHNLITVGLVEAIGVASDEGRVVEFAAYLSSAGIP